MKMPTRCMSIIQVIVASILALAYHVTAESTNAQLGAANLQTTLSNAPEILNDEQETIRLDFRDSAPLVFDSLRSMLRQWPSIYAPNGHSIVPAIVPAWTKLYHTRLDDHLPPSPEWLAFDSEMSYEIFGDLPTSHMLVYRTTKPVMVLYFDGMSASQVSGIGPVDSQDLFIDHRTTRPPKDEPPQQADKRWWAEEMHRGEGLCNWLSSAGVGGPGWGVEGVVRMNAGFELIWCNFTSNSLQLLSHINVTAPLLAKEMLAHPAQKAMQKHRSHDQLRSKADPVTSMTGYEAFVNVAVWESYRAANWHNGKLGRTASVGEHRVKPLVCAMASFYDDQFSSISEARIKQESIGLNLTSNGHWKGIGDAGDRISALKQLQRRRRHHDLQSSTVTDAIRMNHVVRDLLLSIVPRSDQTPLMRAECSGVDWTAVMTDIVLRYGQPLREWIQMFEDAINYTSLKGLQPGKLAVLRVHAHSFLATFLQYPESAFCNDASCEKKTPEGRRLELNLWTLSSPLGQRTLENCHNSYVPFAHMTDAMRDIVPLLPGDRLLNATIANTTLAICRVIVHVGFGVERLWLTQFGTAIDSPPSNTAAISLLTSLRNTLQELHAWLAWLGDDIECRPSCADDHMCFVPMWPLIDFRHWNMSDTVWHRNETMPKMGTDWWEDQWDPVCVKSFPWREEERFREV